MEKLELKHLAPYLPYELMIIETHEKPHKPSVGQVNSLNIPNRVLNYRTNRFPFSDTVHFSRMKLILRPLSDLTKEIEVNGEKFVPFHNMGTDKFYLGLNSTGVIIHQNKGQIGLNSIDVYKDVYSKLFEWHFDVFGLIEKGLAIDINTLNNPPKEK
jgi:hypothetical protein